MSQQVRSGFSLIHQQAIRDLALRMGNEGRPGHYTRVSNEIYGRLDRMVREVVRAMVAESDPNGKTIK